MPEEKRKSRKALAWVKAALGATETLSEHTDDELKELIEDCKELIDAAAQARLANADKAIEAYKAKLAELEQIKAQLG